MPALLPELITDILLRLPVKSLLRFRCLSPSFCSEIDNADFVNNHLNRSIQSRTGQKLIVCNRYFRHPYDFYAADFEDDLKAAFLLNNPLKSQRCRTMVCGSCNGLILLGMIINLRRLIMDLIIWNPFTRRYKKIPLCPVQNLPEYGGVVRFGLGYASALDDYKVVMISCVDESNHVSFPVWIFNMKSSSWRRSRDLLPAYKNGEWGFVARFTNGALYWDGQREIVGFDIANEECFKIQKLSRCCPTTICHAPLVVLGGNLYIPLPCVGRKGVEFYLYVSDNGGEAGSGSWRKEFTVEEEVMVSSDIVRPWPLAYSKEGDSILLLSKQNWFVWYNFENKTSQRVVIPGISEGVPGVPTYKHYVCLESLVSVGNDSAFDGAADEVMVDD